jgi:hypothetical protein
VRTLEGSEQTGSKTPMRAAHPPAIAALSGASVEMLGRAVPEQACYFVPLVLAWSGFSVCS